MQGKYVPLSYILAVLFLACLEASLQRLEAEQVLKVTRMLVRKDATCSVINIRLQKVDFHLVSHLWRF